MKYLIGISTLIYDLSGYVIFKYNPDKSKINSPSRRITRTATLDGTAVIVDNGYTASDLTIEIVPNKLVKSQLDIIDHIIKYHSTVIIDSEYGSFQGVIKSMDESQGYKITFLVEEQLNEV